MTVTTEIVDWLSERANGLQITTFHGSPETAEHLLAAIGPVVMGVVAARGAQHG
jgi:hypothetical protein